MKMRCHTPLLKELKKPKSDPLEKDIEKSVCDHAKQLGCLVYKFTSPSRRSVPDRLFIMPGGVFFIEFKRRGQKPTAGQAVEIAKIRATGVQVFIVDDKLEGRHTVSDMVVYGRLRECTYCQKTKCTCFD